MEQTERTAQKSADQARRVGQEYQRVLQSGFESASRSIAEANRGFQVIAAEVTNYSTKSLEDVLRAWEQLINARSFPHAIDIQTRYAQKTFDAFISEFSKLTDLYLDLTRDASTPVERAARRYT
jgi:hypothetical protein